jgi:hypothetical protein
MTDETDTSTEQPERTPDEVREDIERTRAELGDTVEAVAQKADVKAQAKAKVEERKEALSDKKDEVVSKLKHAAPDSASDGAAQVGSAARENPVPVGIAGALAAGIVIGWWLGRRS